MPVGVDVSWLPFAALVTWGLATEHFPLVLPALTPAFCWAAGAVAAIGQAGMVLAHEFGHIYCARAFGTPTRRVTLFLFGGLAELEREPPSPKAEVLVALAGPAVSVALAILCWALWYALTTLGWAGVEITEEGFAPGLLTMGLAGGESLGDALRAAAVGVLGFWLLVNAAMALFNLLPGFPLDGGRVLRGLLWGATGNLKKANRAASAAGVAVGGMIVGLGIWSAANGGGWGAAWPALMGVAVIAAARWSDSRGRLRRAVSGVPVRRLMRPVALVHAVPAEATLQQYFEGSMLGLGRANVPVVRADGALVGRLSVRSLAATPPDQWPLLTAGEVCEPTPAAARVRPGVDAIAALSWMHHTGRTRLDVVDGGGRLIGVLTAADASRALHRVMDLEPPPEPLAVFTPTPAIPPRANT
ncbi:Putative zinc metalloprotease Rip3 [Alienimonas californiensis]|uniref:Zinc metalloprotease n=1 Tax=Alienimonas californiensis TaxID=2527989 RepID=A0A517PFG1_9PLAN|nr:Putative zinc metalloprotease Rip3 [Alienimonas californiensis]